MLLRSSLIIPALTSRGIRAADLPEEHLHVFGVAAAAGYELGNTSGKRFLVLFGTPPASSARLVVGGARLPLRLGVVMLCCTLRGLNRPFHRLGHLVANCARERRQLALRRDLLLLPNLFRLSVHSVVFEDEPSAVESPIPSRVVVVAVMRRLGHRRVEPRHLIRAALGDRVELRVERADLIKPAATTPIVPAASIILHRCLLSARILFSILQRRALPAAATGLGHGTFTAQLLRFAAAGRHRRA